MAALPQRLFVVRPAYELAVVQVVGDHVSIRAAGMLADSAAQDLSRLLTSHIEVGHPFVRVDLSAVTDVDDACLGAFAHGHNGCLASQGLLLLVGIRDGLRQLFASAALDRCLFLARSAGTADWVPNLPGLGELVRRERGRRAVCGPPSRHPVGLHHPDRTG